MPSLRYEGICTETGTHTPGCGITKYNIDDAFPYDQSQWKDSDGDGYGDNPDGNQGDAFPGNSLEWEDLDGDGYGDNSDACPTQAGELNAVGCPDEDGDGFPDTIDNFRRAYLVGEYLDQCPDVYGTAFRQYGAGCPDSDNDLSLIHI